MILELLGQRFKSIDTERVQFGASLVVGMCLASNFVSRVSFFIWYFISCKESIVSPAESMPPNVVSSPDCVDKFEARRQLPLIS